MELHPHELRILKVLKKKTDSEELAKSTELNPDTIMRASSWLVTKNLVKIHEETYEEISLGEEGKLYAEKGLPERQVLSKIGNEKAISDIKGLDRNIVNIALGWLRRKDLATLENGVIKVRKTDRTVDETLLELLKKRGSVKSTELDEDMRKGLDMLRSRKNVVVVRERKNITLEPTDEGIKLGKSTKDEGTVSQLTPKMLLTGEWKNVKFRPYDVDVYAKPAFPAKRHPLIREIENIRNIFVEMGFSEIAGPLVESAFWNFDALFQPQDHPARDMHDTFYLKTPKSVPIKDFESLKKKVGETHENGGSTESTGWGYKWSEEIAKKTLLRTHTTAVTCKYLSTIKEKDLPAKVFCIGKVFRNEAVDYKHLPEFHQVEGIVVDHDANFRDLLGILREFYDRMGFKVRFRPGYFPYTEMSVEPEIFFEEKKEWIELGGSGIFRPEVVKPLLGFECPVLAWGLGLDRVVALKLGLTDIRQLYISDLDWLRSA